MDYAGEWDRVTEQTWPLHLPHILQDLSDCAFVALDFEFSGIPAIGGGRQTLQERYAESRAAAQKYQILQVGLTIVKEDAVAGKYILKPYNLYLSPLIDPVLGIDRTFSFSSAATQFLLKIGFSLESPFQEGVRYLSTKEEVQAVHEASKHISRARTVSMAQVELPKEEPQSVAFLAAVRRDIDKWLESGQKTQNYLNVPSRNAAAYSDGRPAVTSLNRYQKRLVHQLVETEYPSLTSIGRADFIKILNYDEEREENIRQQKVRRLESRLLEHRGFRWIIEALTGGDALSQLNTKTFEPLVLDGANYTARCGAVEDFAMNIKARLQSKKGRPPVVGHNLFLDMVYMWQCFYGDLPDQVEEFIHLLHAKFPMLVDTKYIFTHECGDMNPVASLDVIDEACRHITNPEIIIDPKHTRYQGHEQPHEAGYDSLLTAKNFIRQATKLRDVFPGPSQLASKTTPLPVSLNQTKSIDISSTKPSLDKDNPGSTSAHQNVFATLTDGDNEASDSDLASELDGVVVTNADNVLIPSFSSPIWKIYGNKLRMFGTYERVCILDKEV